MTMGEHSTLVPLVYPLLFRNVLTQMAKNDPVANTVRSQISSAEKHSPGVLLDLLLAILKKANVNISVHEALLRQQGSTVDEEEGGTDFRRIDEPFRELSKKSSQLKRILARIPDEIIDRKTFLETIKEIASTIKKVLDAVTAVSMIVSNQSTRALLDQRKREFVKYSKRFSTTLKDYFREGIENQVYVSALYLINQVSYFQNCEWVY